MVTEMEGAINCLVEVFHKYSLTSGHHHTLSKDKFRKLLETEMPEVLTNPKNPKTVEKVLKEVDSNKDGMINFEEFLFLTTRMLVDAHDASHE